jgi:hypothetical protein
MSIVVFGVETGSLCSDASSAQGQALDLRSANVDKFSNSRFGSEKQLPLPDFSAFAQKNVRSLDESKSNTPPEMPPKQFMFSPSLKPSPVAPKPSNEYHDPEKLLKTVPKKAIRGFKAKPRHTLALTSPFKDRILLRPDVANYVSLWSKHLAANKQGTPPSIEPIKNIRVTVLAPDTVEVKNLLSNRTRVFGIHRQPDGRNKSYYPKGGDGTVSFDSNPNRPADLLKMVENYRANHSHMDPQKFLETELRKLY